MSTSEVSSEPTLFDQAIDEPASVEPPSEQPAPKPAPKDRKRLAEQLDALKRKESELRRAIAVTDHPELAEAIQSIESSAANVARAQAKLAQGFSKTQARKRDAVEKKLGSLRGKRAELDGQIAALEAELGGLGAEEVTAFEQERQQALGELRAVLATHAPALQAAGLEPAALVPELNAWLGELEGSAAGANA